MTHKQRVLHLLSDKKPHSHHELYRLGCVAHSRISDLRKDGHRIRQWRENDLYLYQLENALDEVSALPSRSPSPDHAETSSSAPGSNLQWPEGSSLGLLAAADAQDPPRLGDGAGVLTLFGDAA